MILSVSYLVDVPLHDVMADASYNRFTLDGVDFDQGDHVYVSLNSTQLSAEITGGELSTRAKLRRSSALGYQGNIWK